MQPGRCRVFVTAFFAGLALAFHATADDCFPAPNGMVSWWWGDGDANDVVGGHNGVLQGGATASAPGVVYTAFQFDGTNGYVRIPDSPALRPANLTVEAWVWFDALDSQGSGGSPPHQQYIVFKQNTRTSQFEGYCLLKMSVNNQDCLGFIVNSASGVAAKVFSVTTVTPGVWYHVAGVRGPDFIQLYVNGYLERQTNVSFPQDYGNYPFYFGTTGQAWDHKLKGKLDEVSLYNRALTAEEIAGIYNAGAAGKCTAPVITAQPQGGTVPTGADVSLSVTAIGVGELYYQWQRNSMDLVDGGNISGANSPTLRLGNVQPSDSASYRVVVTDVLGTTISDVAVLAVNPALVVPSFTLQPVGQAVPVGTNATFTAAATGTAPLSYQWRFNGANLSDGGQFSGAASSALTIHDVLPANAGGYSVVVTNVAGAATSSVATLIVETPSGCLPTPDGLVGWWPGDGNANDIMGNHNGTLQGGATATAVGVNGFAFSFDGTNSYVEIPDSPALRPTNLTVEAWVRFRAYESPGTTHYPYQQYIVFKQNSRATSFEGFSMSKDHDPQGDVILFEVTSASGELVRIDTVSTVVTGVWYHVVGVRGPDYTQLYMNGHLEAQASVSFPQDYGDWPLYFGSSGQSYYDRKLQGELDEVALYNRALSSNEIAALYLAGSAGKCKMPRLLAQPQDQVGYWGGNIIFTAAATGLPPLYYQWSKDGSPIAGATNAWLALTNLQMADAGRYVVVVTNSLGSASSDSVFLRMKLADISLSLSGSGGAQAFAGLKLAGVAGQTYGVQYCSSLSQSSRWIGLTNLTLNAAAQVWSDPQPATESERYYRVVPGPIPIP